MSKHTSGKWETSGTAIMAGKVRLASCYYSPEGGSIGGIKSSGVSRDECYANATLMALAPEMLKALILCERALEERDTEAEGYAAKKARSIISKAIGARTAEEIDNSIDGRGPDPKDGK